MCQAQRLHVCMSNMRFLFDYNMLCGSWNIYFQNQNVHIYQSHSRLKGQTFDVDASDSSNALNTYICQIRAVSESNGKCIKEKSQTNHLISLLRLLYLICDVDSRSFATSNSCNRRINCLMRCIWPNNWWGSIGRRLILRDTFENSFGLCVSLIFASCSLFVPYKVPQLHQPPPHHSYQEAHKSRTEEF